MDVTKMTEALAQTRGNPIWRQPATHPRRRVGSKLGQHIANGDAAARSMRGQRIVRRDEELSDGI